MPKANIMNVNDIMSGTGGSAYLTLHGSEGDERFCLFNIRKYKAQVDLTKKERGLLGSPRRVNYVTGWKGTWSATVDFNVSTYTRMMQVYKDTGEFPRFEIQTTNENYSGNTGKQEVILKECLLDSAVIAMFDTEADSLTQDISGTFDDFEVPTAFTEMPGYRVS